MNKVAMLGLALGASVLAAGVIQARPIYIEESAVLTPPNNGVAYAFFGFHAATNGAYALVVGKRAQTDLETTTYDALLYRRTSSGWQYARILSTGGYNENDDPKTPIVIGMKGNLASAELSNSGTKIYRFNGTDWVPAGTGTHPSDYVSIDGNRILYGGDEGWDGQVFEPDGSGGWKVTELRGQNRCCDDEFWGGPVDLLGDRAILGTPYPYLDEAQEIPIYQRYADGSWQLLAKLQVPTGGWLGDYVGLHADKAIVSGNNGHFVWSNVYGEPDDRLQPANAYAQAPYAYLAGRIAKDGNLVAAYAFDPDLQHSVINIFRPDAAGKYEHVAVLKTKNGQALSGWFEMQGNTVVAGGEGKAYVFQLPATMTAHLARYERFESGNGASWTPRAGSQFTVVRPTPLNGVYRQSNTAGDAHSVLTNTSWRDQAIEADVRASTLRCADCWVGLATRYSNDQNYYYVTLRNSGTVQLKRRQNGAFVTLASAPVTMQLNRTYRLRLESIGTAQRVYLDGKLVLNAQDAATLAPGNAAIVMYGAAADYDNVIVTPTPRATLYADDFTGTENLGTWSYTGTGQWSIANNAFTQTSLAGNARAVIGTPTDDQIVGLRVRPTAFAAGTATQERWVGVVARYTDIQNYYYLTLRNSNRLSLRKLVNGVASEIVAVPVTVNTSTTYALRLEVTGQSLRVYLNGALVMQGVDKSHAKGRTGVMTYKTAAQYDDYVAYRP
jgi:hypothetical protein